MSEKRFELSEIYSNTIMDTENCVNNGSHCRMYDIEEVVDLLNELATKCSRLEEENEKLIQKQCLPCELVNLQTREINKLKEENKQLKQKLEILALNGKKNDAIKMIDGRFFIRM